MHRLVLFLPASGGGGRKERKGIPTDMLLRHISISTKNYPWAQKTDEQLAGTTSLQHLGQSSQERNANKRRRERESGKKRARAREKRRY